MCMLITDKDGLKDYTAENRLWQGIPGIEKSKKGRLFATFFSGSTGEVVGNFAGLIKSDDDGLTWSEPIAVAFKEGQNRCFDPCIWFAPDGKLWFFWALRRMDVAGKPVETYAAFTENADADEPEWCKPIFMGPGVMINKPLVCFDGDIIFSISSWAHDVEKNIDVYRSRDNGLTREKIGSVSAPGMVFGEQIVVERDDLSLAMYIRTTYGIGVSYSFDGGCTWTEESDSGYGGPCSRFFIKKLKSGKLLLVNHYNFTKRNNLTAMLSDDDGKTWYGYLMIDERDYAAYPDAVEDDDGRIYIVYDHARGAGSHSLKEALASGREILMAVVTEKDIASGSPVTDVCRLKETVNKLGAYNGKDKNPYGELERYTEEEYINLLFNMKSGNDINERIYADYSYKCVNLSIDLINYIDGLFEKLGNEENFDDPVKRIYYIKQVLSAVKQTETGDDRVPPEEITDKLFNYINEHLEEDTDLEKMARELFISKYYMCFLFKQKTGVSIVTYKNYQRVASAKKLLRFTETPITEIGLKVGFADASYFAKWFKKIEGITPSEFRKLNG